MMREAYRGWYGLDDSEREALWESGTVVVDTNVLLDLYRTSPQVRSSLLQALEGVRERLWMPHHIGVEFHKLRASVRRDAIDRHGLLAKEIEKVSRSLTKQVRGLADANSEIDAAGTLRSNLLSAADALSAELRESAKELIEDGDPVLETLEALYPDSRVGEPFSQADAWSATREAVRRAEFRIPPGFADSDKGGALGHGDYYLWHQTITHAAATGHGVIFVSRDQKEDWVQTGQALPELFDEFYRATGKTVLFIHPSGFIREVNQRGYSTLDAGTDVEAVTEDYRRSEEAEQQWLTRKALVSMTDAMATLNKASYESVSGASTAINSEAVKAIGQALAKAFRDAGWFTTGASTSGAGAARDIEDDDADAEDED